MMDKHAQPLLNQLGAYPFERLKKLFQHSSPNPELLHIDAGAGEPRLPLPSFVQDTLNEHIQGFSKYPATRGNADLQRAIARWLKHRFHLQQLDMGTQVLTANGTREALFAIAHTLVNPEAKQKPYVMMPNPMYQIYYGAAVTAGAEPYLLHCLADDGFEPYLDNIDAKTWERTAFMYVCSPSNPTGWIAKHDYYARLLELADRYDFYIVADECYSEIYTDEPPIGLLEVAQQLGRNDFSRCLVMNSLSKRSALPGLRSGLIAGDATLIARFAKLRSYTGPATPLPLQAVAAKAWSDEQHVAKHLDVYRNSLHAFFDVWSEAHQPEGSFFVWLAVDDDEAFAKAAYEQQAVTVLPGSYLGANDAQGCNAGAAYIRAALVDGADKAAELAVRLKKVRV
ncbi:MAG: aminotransferase class I/II-fold pyridoxal phosphate-dependent enzyme [Mariprofundaceae bacterium]|nr:aminotransferase class I/II-fold pyridoxal phosphate-dependent enzyme [Mariprofundaceae bacterium]